MSSAIETHHSVLGWNHPGFGYSTVNNIKHIYYIDVPLYYVYFYY